MFVCNFQLQTNLDGTNEVNTSGPGSPQSLHWTKLSLSTTVFFGEWLGFYVTAKFSYTECCHIRKERGQRTQ